MTGAELQAAREASLVALLQRLQRENEELRMERDMVRADAARLAEVLRDLRRWDRIDAALTAHEETKR